MALSTASSSSSEKLGRLEREDSVSSQQSHVSGIYEFNHQDIHASCREKIVRGNKPVVASMSRCSLVPRPLLHAIWQAGRPGNEARHSAGSIILTVCASADHLY